MKRRAAGTWDMTGDRDLIQTRWKALHDSAIQLSYRVVPSETRNLE